MSSLKEPSSTPEGLLTIAILSAVPSVAAASEASSAAGAASVSASAGAESSVLVVVSSAAGVSVEGCALSEPQPIKERAITEERISANTFFFIRFSSLCV